MKIIKPPNVDIGNAIAIGKEERLSIWQVLPHRLEAPAGHGVVAGIDQGHAPGFCALLVNFHGVFAHVEGDVRGVQEVVAEVLLDQVAAVAAADDEVVQAVGAVGLHDVPDDGPTADLHHRWHLWRR